MKTKSIFTKTLLSVICAFALTFGLFFISPSALKASASEIDMTLVKIDESGNIDANGEYVEFGSYPQSRVTDENLIGRLALAAGNTSLSNVQSSWTSYGYPLVVKNENEPAFNDTQTQFMWYKDLTLDDSAYGGKYRAFVFSEYRKCINNSGTFQQDNGYEVSTAENVNVYWFKFEPIKWKILSEENGNALLFSTVILDSHYINSSYGNDYATGDGISWLNGTFYNTAFNASEQAYVKNTSVEGTNAKLFYLSLDELKNTAYGFAADETSADPARKRVGTDYAKSQGLYSKEYWTRTPNEHGSNDKTETIFNDGSKSDCNCYSTYIGVVPALNVSMPEQPHLHNVCGEASCSHDGHSSISYTALDQELFDSFFDSTQGICVIPNGNYYLTENITINENAVIARYNVSNLCLNGFNLNFNTAEILPYNYSNSDMLTFSNCSNTESSVQIDKMWGNINLYGNIVYNVKNKISSFMGIVNIYGGTVNCEGLLTVDVGTKFVIGDAKINCNYVNVYINSSVSNNTENVALDLSSYKGDKLKVAVTIMEGAGGYAILGTFDQINLLDYGDCAHEENGYIVVLNDHSYANGCDAGCVVCGREKSHAYDNGCDSTCNDCNATRDVTHVYDNDCDTTCSRCDHTRTVGDHVYDNACDADCRTEITCSHCASVTTAGNPDHVPNADDGDCTTAITCSHCASVITEGRPAHDFNGEYLTDETHHWKECLYCDVHSSKGEHSLDENGVCESCEFGKVEEPDGLSGGAIAGIAVGSATGLGIIAFVIFWFVIKKNSFADLLKIFKK